MKLTQINYQEDEITSDYFIGEDSCLINNFEFKDTRNDEMKSLEFISDNNSSICLYGFLQKHPRNTTNSFFVKILHLKQWDFSESGEIIVQSSRYWFKLLNPSPEYAPIFDLFEQRYNLWRKLKPFLTNWMNDLSNCVDKQELTMVKNDITIEKVLQKLPNTSQDNLLEHAKFLYDQILEDTIALKDESGENQMLDTPLLFTLKENRFKKKENQLIKITKETALMDGIELSDSDSYEENEMENEVEKDFGISSEDESENSNSEPTPNKSKRRKYKNRETPTKKKKSTNEDKGKRQKKAMKQVYTTTHKMEEGIPSRNYFLEAEFSPQILSELSVKYEPGICHSVCFQCKKRRIACYKERPVCSNCLKEGLQCSYPDVMRLSPCVPCGERGGKVCNREKPTCDICIERKTNCYYFSSDTFLILAEKNIKSAKEQNGEDIEKKNNITTWNDEAYSEILKEMDEKIKKYDNLPNVDNEISQPPEKPKQQKAKIENTKSLEDKVERWKKKAEKEQKKRSEIKEKLEQFIENLD